MTFTKGAKSVQRQIVDFEKQDILEYCKKQAFSETETKKFVENSINTILETRVGSDES